MPRVSPKTLVEALKIHRALPLLLPVCRDLTQARQELRWIKLETSPQRFVPAVLQRSRHYPLQYILGTQPFGDLEIRCKPGVLIPRNDTEEWCYEVVEVLRHLTHLKVLDMCTGTGCIALLMAKELAQSSVVGVDISDKAVELSRENLELNMITNVRFEQGDLKDQLLISRLGDDRFDLIVSNPPYIPASEFNTRSGMEKSVRLFEPSLLLKGDSDILIPLVKNVLLSSCEGFIVELAGIRQVEMMLSLFGEGWRTGHRIDSNGQVRNVIGWKVGSKMDLLEKLCHSVH